MFDAECNVLLMRIFSRVLGCVLACLLALTLLVEHSYGQETPEGQLGQVLVLPFANRSGATSARAAFESPILAALRPHFQKVWSGQDLRPILRRHRIRSLGSIGRRGVELLHQETSADYALVGAYEVFANTPSREVGLSLRLLRLDTGGVVASVVGGASWQDTRLVFGRRSAQDQLELSRNLVLELVDELLVQARQPISPAHKSDLVAVVQLNDHSEQMGASVAESAILDALMRARVPVVEPGFLRELQLDHSMAERGGISERLARLLVDEFGVRWLLTGAVDRYRLANADSEEAVPRVSWGLRLLDAPSLHLVSAIDLEQTGTDGDSLLGRGRIYSGIDLLREGANQRILPWFEKEIRP